MVYSKNFILKIVLVLATCITLFFLFGGYIYREYSIRNFTPEWKKFARSSCPSSTVWFLISGSFSGISCCLETVRGYSNIGALLFDGEACPQGYVKTHWVPMCSGILACYPEDTSQSFPKPQVEFHTTDDFPVLEYSPSS